MRVLERICAKAKHQGVSPHVLRHTFAGAAADLGFSGLAIAGPFGHSPRGDIQRYAHFDRALIVATDRASSDKRKNFRRDPIKEKMRMESKSVLGKGGDRVAVLV